MKRTVLLLLGMILMWTLQVNAQWSITTVGTDHTIDFETTVSGINEGTFDGTGFATTPAAGQLDADGWAVFGMSDGDKDFGVENTTGDLARGTSPGGEIIGGTYAFEVETGNYALGVQPSGSDFAPGWIGAIIENNSGNPVNTMSLSYDIWVYNDEDRANSFNGEYSVDGITWFPIEDLTFLTPEVADASPAWSKTTLTLTDQYMGFDFEDGNSIYFRWYSQDISGGGGRDEIAIDNFTVNFTYEACPTIATFPFEESFESTYPATCWDTVYANPAYPAGNEMTHTTDEAYEGSQSYRFSSFSSGSPYEQYLITPDLNMSSEKVLEFWYKKYSSGSETFTVGTSTTGTNVATDFTWEADVTNASTTWQKYTLNIDPSVKYIAIQYKSSYQYYLYIDDFTLRDLSSETDFLTYSFPEQTGPATIDDVNHEIDIEVDFTADLTNLVADFTLSTGATAQVGSTPQESGVTANDFSSPVIYTVFSEDGTTTQDWTVTVTQTAPPLGANCSNPFTVILPAALPYTDAGQTNCGLGDIYSETSMDGYDGGEDAIYEITVTSDVVVSITLYPGATTYTGFGVFESCPDNDLLVDQSTNSSASQHSIESVVLTAGTYYIMVDTWPSPDCIPTYDLTIEEVCPAPTDIEATDMTPTSALVTWIPAGLETAWELKVDTTSIDPTADPGYIFDGPVTPNPEQSITGLDPDSTYYVYVQADCSSGWSTEYTFTTPSACPQPTDVFVSDLGSDFAMLDWNAYGETEWVVKVSDSPIAPDTEDGNIVTAETTTDKPYSVSGLSPNTDYYFYVQSSCGSDWSTEFMFTTECAVYPVPFDEDFAVFLPNCWSESEALLQDPIDLTVETTSDWIVDDFANNTSNPQSAKLNIFGTSKQDWLISPEIDLGDGSTPYQLEFDLALTDYANEAAPDTDGDDDVFAVVISTDGGVTWEEANVLRRWDNAGSPYVYNDISYTGEPVIIDLTAYTDVVKIAFYGESTVSNADNDLFVNNVEIIEVPSCPTPTDLTASSITTSSASISWTENGTAGSWNVIYGAPGFDPATEGTVEVASAIPHDISGLSPNTSYDVYVSADCGGLMSDTTGPMTFNTDCEAVATFPWTEDFEDGVPPECWTEVRTPSSTYGWSSNTSGVTGNCARFNSYLNSSGNISELSTLTLDISTLSNPVLSFTYKNPTGGDFSVMLSTDNGATYPNTLFSGLTGTTDWTEMSADLSTYIGSEVKIAFVGTSNYGIGDAYVYLDDVTVREVNTETDILTYSFPQQTTAADIDDVNHTVDVEVGTGTDLTTLVADFTLSTGATAQVGVVLQESGVTVNDFGTPVTYTVFAEDGTTTQDWVVTVTEAGIYTEAEILDFSFPEETGPSTIDTVANTVDIEVNFLADLTNLVAEFELSYGATAEIGGTVQASGVTANDFTDPVTYTIIAEDGSTTQDYTVTVTQAGPPAGATCATAMPYTAINDPEVITSINSASRELWFTVELDQPYVDIQVSTCGSVYDTKVYVYDACGGNELAYDDDAPAGFCSVANNQSLAEIVSLDAGTYYVLITPYGATTDISDPTTGLLVTGSDCGTPADVTATDLTPTSALITWTPLTLETAWNLKVSSTSLTDPATETGDVFDGTVSTTPEQAISVLTAETDYYVYVQADCGSDWSTEYMFTTPAACPQPTDLFASAIATDYAELDWTAYGETEWNIKVSTTTIDPTTDPGDVVDELLTTSKPYPVSGLTQNTTYYFYVQSSCGSDWSPEGMFTTECDAITTFPWNEDFETTSATVDCWTVIDNNDDGDAWEIQTSSTYANSGDQSYDLHTDYNSGDNDDYLISPAITLTGNEQLRFFERVRSSGEPNDFEVLLSTTGKDPADFTEVLLPLSEYDNTTYEEITLYLSAYTGTVYIAFHVPSGGLDGYHLYIDDVTIEPMPSCVPVTDLTVESTTTTSATIGWTEFGTATDWNVIYGESGFDPATEGTTESATAIPHTVNALTPGTMYDFYVYADCGGGDLSDTVGPVSAQTDCEAVTTFPWTEDFDGDWTTWCWTVINNDSDSYTWEQDDQYLTPHSGSWTAHGMGNNDDYLISPEISVNAANLLVEWWDVVESSTNNNTYDVLISTTDTDPASFTDNLGTYDCTNETWTEHSLNLSAYDGQTIYIAFHQTYSAATYYGFGIDDVTVREMNTETDILTYSFAEQTGPATIDDVNHTVDVEVAYGTDLTGLVADFTLSDVATAEVIGVLQESGVTANDFTSPVTYTVIAEDGTTTQDWVVTVTEQMPDLALIEPTSDFACDFTNAESLYVEIDNVGDATIPSGDSIIFVLDNEGTILIDEYIYLTSDLTPGSTYSGFTDTEIDLSVVGTYLYEASITHLDDANPDNDTIDGYLVHFSQEIEFVDAVNDTISINATDYPYTIESNVVYTPDSTLTPAYLWDGGETTSTLDVNTDGWYYLTVTTNGCTVEDSVYVDSYTTIEGDKTADFAIYPNPTEGDVMLEMTLAEKQDVVITITNSSGQIIGNYKFDDVDQLREPIDLNGVAQGLYNLRVNAGDKFYTRQVVVK